MRRYNHIKRFMMILLALLLCLENMPISAFAEEETSPERIALENELSEDYISDEAVYTESKLLDKDLFCQISENLETTETEEDVNQSFLTSTYDDNVPESKSETEEPIIISSEENTLFGTEHFERDNAFEGLSLNAEAITERFNNPNEDVKLVETYSDHMPAGSDTDTADDGTIATAVWDSYVFPEGTCLQIDTVDSDYASEIGRTALGNNVQILDAVAFDVSFCEKDDGENLQPYESGIVHVELKLTSALSGDTFYLVHIKDGGEYEFIESAIVDVQILDDGSMQASGVSFDGFSFSVYALLATNQKGNYARRCYRFFVNNSLFASQMVTKEDTLADPGIPILQENEEFAGWYLNNDESRKPVTIDELRDELSIANIMEGETVDLTAIVLHTYTVKYLDENDTVIKTLKAYDGEDFTVSENYEPQLANSVFHGWTLGETVYSVGERIPAVSGNLELKPKLNRTFLLTFYMNCECDSVSVIPPVVVEEGTDLSLYLPDTEMLTRPGYVFTGWFLGKDVNGSITLEDDEITEGLVTCDETLYAKWEPVYETIFTVQIWKQSLEDDYRIGLTADSPYYDKENDKSSEEKTYIYDKTIQLYGTTGSEVSSSDGFKECLVSDEGFYLSGIEYLDSDGNEIGVISSDGKTVVNIYFDRQIWALTFSSIQNHFVEDAESKINVYGKTEYGDDYFSVFYLCTAKEASDNQPRPQYGTINNTDYFTIYYRKAYSFVPTDYSNNNLYRINDNGTKYVRIYYNINDGNYHYEQSADSPVYTGIRYAADKASYKWVKADSDYGVEYQGTRYLEPVYSWYTENSTSSNQYNGIRYRIETENCSSSFYGLYGQDFQRYDYIWPADTVWDGTPFINSFTDIESFAEDPDDETIRNWTISADSTSTELSAITVVYYSKETGGTSYKRLASSSCRLEDGEEYHALNPFPGMLFTDYFWSNSTEEPGDAVAWLTGQQGEDGEISCGEKESNSVLHLRYVPKYYKLIFKDAQFSGERSILKTIEIPFGSCFSEYMDQAPSDVRKEDYAFMGWYLDSQCTVGFNWTGKMYASDVTVYAGWEKCNYRVMINLCDDTDSPAIYNSELSFLVPAFERIKLTTPSRPGYEYKGLYSDPDYDQEFSETMAISAAIKEIDMSYPSSHEYENGLEDNGVLLHGAENETNHVAGKLNLYVKWEKVETVSLRIVYDANGGDNAPVDPENYYGQDYAAAHSVCTAPEGKAFLCWTYMDVTTGEEVEVYPGHYFPLQQAEKTITEENGNRVLTVILKAKYVEKQIPGKVTVVFDPNGGVGDFSITVEANQTFSIPSENEAGIVRDGYCLLGWNTATDGSGEFFEIGENAAANTSGINILYAVWDPEITLLFSVNQAEFGNVDKDRITLSRHEQGSISVTAEANEHCIFTEWLLNGEVISTENILYLSIPESGWITAEYQAVFERETLAVSYELDADDAENAPGIQRIPYGERAIRPENPIRNGYRFAGWKSSESDYDFALPVTKDLTLTAQWKQEFYVSYSVCSSQNGVKLDVAPTDNEGYLPGETVSLKAYPISPEGYDVFDGWYTDDIKIHDGSFVMPANNVVLSGTFMPISYEISYELNGGRAVEINPTSYTVESSAILLNRPIKEGYVFTGWIGSNGTEAQTEVTIPAGSIGDLNYTATWSPSLNTTYHVVVHYPLDWIMPESIEDAEINLEQRTVSYACTGMTGSVVNTRAFRSPDDLRLTYDSEHPDNVPQGNIEPDGTLVLHAYLKRVEYFYTVQFCLRGTEKTVATKTGIAEPDSSGTAVTEVSLENAVFLDEYANYVSHMAIAGDNQVTVNKDNANVVVPIVIKVCVDRMDNRELYANGKEQYGYSINEITGTAFSSDSEDGHITVSGLLPGESIKIDFIPASGTNVGTYLPVYNGASFYTGESRVQYYTFDGFDPQTMGRLTILETVTVTWINGDDVLCVDPYVPPGSVPIYSAEMPIKPSDFRYTYSFIGWNPEVGPVSKNTTYEAVFSKNYRQYTVTWENWDGTVAWQKEYNYGSTPTYGGPGQVKPEDAEYTYTFSSWSPAVSEVDGNAVYKPVFTRTPRKFLVTYELNGVPYGSVLQKPFGETIILSEDPQLEGHSFSGWSSEDVLIENRTFTMPSKDVIIVGSFRKIEKQVFDPNNLTEAQKAIAATDLTYNGIEQDLVTSPTSLPEGYTGLRFSTDNGETWNASIPKATDAGEYLVLVQYVGDTRHEDFIADGISVVIAKAEITSFRATVFEELVYTGEERVLLTAVSDLPEGASVEYLVCDTDNHIYRDWSDELPYAVFPGSYLVYYRINGGKNYQSVLQTRIDNGSDQNTVITKADQTLPRKPSAVATDAHSITVDQTVIGQEYVLLPAGHVPSEDDWTENGRQASDGATLVFDNLSACQNYVVYTRKAANDCYNASNYIASETVTMPKESQSIPTSAVVATATCTSITVKSAYPSQEYSLDLGNSWLKASEGSNELTFENLKPNTEYRLISRMAETDTCSASEATDPITVKTLTGKIKTEVRTSGAATLDIAVTGLDEQLAKKLITTDEIERVLYGQTAAVYLLVSNNELSMSTSEKVLIEEAAKEKNKDAVVCMSLDISLYKQLESESPIAITSIGTDTIEITLEIPKQFRNTDANTERSFYIVRVHAGKAEILQPTVTGNSLTFSTGRFSTYAIFYVDRMESVSAAAGTESASGTATLASATGSATGTSVPTAASVSVTGTVAGNATYAGAGTTLAESAANEIKTETGEKTAENRTEWTDGIENRSNEPNTDIQRKDIIYENNYSTDDNSISGLFLQSARRTLLLIPLLGLIVTGYAAVRRRREKRSDEE